MAIQVANFQGIGAISQSIRLLTYSVYSHTAAHFTEDMEVDIAGMRHFIAAGSVIEAWAGGVRLVPSLSAQHTPGTKVDLMQHKTPLTRDQEQIAAKFLMGHVLKKTKYAYRNVLRFVPIVRIVMPEPPPLNYLRTRVYCTELVLEAFIACGRPLFERCPAWEVPPRDPPRSTVLYFDKRVTTH